jgi:glycosyltransferase involved in cell wall biosynthesis
VIPVFNERNTLPKVVVAVANALPAVDKQVIIVDDGSVDGTREWLMDAALDGVECRAVVATNAGRLEFVQDGETCRISIVVCFHESNRGKGGALQTGLALATNDVIVIQDADLEYDPTDWGEMFNLIVERKVADVVYGSRFFGRAHRSLYYHHYLGNRVLSVVFNLLYNQTLNDIEVCYKMFTREVLQTLRLTAFDFGIEVQISAQIALHRRWRIYEVGISYYGRSYAEGKKINWKDGIKALGYLIRFRVAP